MKYIKIFENEHDYQTFISTVDYKIPNVSYILDSKNVKYTPRLAPLPYLTIEALEDELTTQLSVSDCEYSLDGKTWIDLPANTETPKIKTGKKLYFKKILSNSNSSIGTFTISKKFKLSGNCNSMIFGDNAKEKLDITGYNNIFSGLFSNCNSLIEVSSNFLPATTLANSCYSGMFAGCTSLTTAPDLPAINLSDTCYSGMFADCTSLTTAPELPATNLSDTCYESMFQNCSALTTAPDLPATNLTNYCYMNMFAGCTSLSISPKTLGENVSNSCCYRMFRDCTSLETAPELPATTLAESCYLYMFQNCSALTTAPELPATKLVSNCYGYMFINCTNLKYIKALFTTTPSSSYTGYWVSNVGGNGTFVKNAAATWNVTGNNGVPSGWTVETV